MTNTPTSAAPRKPRHPGAGIVVGFLGSITVALLVAIVALFAVHDMTERQRQSRDQAVLLAEIERLRFTLEQRVASSRGFLLTQDPALLAELEDQRKRFDERRASLVAAHPELAPQFETIEQAEQAYHREILATNQVRVSTPSGFADVFERLRGRLRETRSAVESALSDLAASTREQIESHSDDNESLEQRTTIIFIGAVVLLAIAAILGLGVTRRLRQTVHRELELRQNAEALASEVVEQSKEVERRFREVTHELEQFRSKQR